MASKPTTQTTRPTGKSTNKSTSKSSKSTTRRRTKNHGSSVKDDRQYEALRRRGASKEKAARVANAGTRKKTGSKGGSARRYEDRTKDELYEKAKQVGIEGRSKMDKGELIQALRNH